MRLQQFCDLFRRSDTVSGCHMHAYGNDKIRVGTWDGPRRRVAFMAPYSAPGWVKKAVGAHHCLLARQSVSLALHAYPGQI